jgi:hypothetical protein
VSVARVSSLVVYPVKGMRGVPVERAEATARGLRFDRRFVVVRAEDGQALTQREHPKLALGHAAIDERTLTIAIGERTVAIAIPPLEAPDRRRRPVRVFGDVTEGVDAGPDAAELLSSALGEPAALAFMPDAVLRPVEEEYSLPGDHVSYADGYPILLAATASLAALNTSIAAAGSVAVSMTRFRPNIVVDGSAAWEEERASGVRIGEVELRTPKKCARCVVTTVDQDTALKGPEPLRTLARTRASGNGAHFAMNAIPVLRPGAPPPVLAVGDPVVFSLS